MGLFRVVWLAAVLLVPVARADLDPTRRKQREKLGLLPSSLGSGSNRLYGPKENRSLYYPIAPDSFPTEAPAVAATLALAAESRARLARLLQRLAAGDERKLCTGPFPPRATTKLRWVHFPKCGSTFYNTILKYGCAAVAERPDVFLGAPMPIDVEAALVAAEPPRTAGQRPRRVRTTIGTQELSQYTHLMCVDGEHRFLNANDLGRTLESWAHHHPLRGLGDTGQGAVAVFRSPAQRALSAYHFGRHTWGSEMKGPEIGSKFFIRWREWIQQAKTPRDFVATPGVSGCLTKMLAGCYCASRPWAVEEARRGVFEDSRLVACPYKWLYADQALAQKAAEKLEKFAFVGVQEAYNASVCLFHKLFGGEPDPSEFSIFNAGRRGGAAPRGGSKYKLAAASAGAPAPWNEAPLGDFVDVLDEHVWHSALLRFERDLDAALAR